MKLNKKEEIEKIIIKPDYTIRDVIKNLNKTGLKIAIVTDKNNKLFGTIVDGDIRRGLLNGLGLDDKIDSIIYKNPRTTNSKIKTHEATEIMKINYLSHLPVVDENFKLIGLHTLDEVVRPPSRENKFIIMAGGFGKRLLPLTKNKPKALINVLGKPMLEHIVLKAKSFGFKNFTFSINYLGHMVKEYFSSGEKFNVKIDYIEEKKPLGTAGSLFYLKDIKNQTFLVTNCDVISDIDYGDAIDYHKSHNADVTMVVRRYETQNPFGVIETKGNNFHSYHEKPIKYENINSGIYIIESNVLKYLENEKYKDMPDFFTTLVKEGKKVIVYPIYEEWYDLGQKNIKLNISKQKTKTNKNL